MVHEQAPAELLYAEKGVGLFESAVFVQDTSPQGLEMGFPWCRGRLCSLHANCKQDS